MTDNKIVEGNKLIAEFMGWSKSDYHNTPNKMYNGAIGIHVDHLQYHTSWDWLMPVVEKIEDCRIVDDYGFSVNIDNWQVIIKSLLSGKIITSNLSGAKSKIEATWQAVVEFIKWYNQNK